MSESGSGGISTNSTANGSILNGENTPDTLGVAGKLGGGRRISDSSDSRSKVGGIFVDGSQDCTKFDGVFTIEECTMPGDGWKIILTPTVSAMRRLIGRVELTGDALPTNAVLESADGGSSVIRFKELPRVR